MKKIGITGSNGLIGYHLRVFLKNVENTELKLATRETFQSEEALLRFSEDLDVIVHLADKNVGAVIKLKIAVPRTSGIPTKMPPIPTIFIIKPADN